MVDISKIARQPVFAFESKMLGHLTFRYLSVGATIKLHEADEAKAFAPDTFFDALVARLGRKPPPEHPDEAGEEQDGFSKLSDADIAQLSPDERTAIAEGLVGGLGLDREPVWETETDEEGRQVSRIASYEVLLERQDGETAEEFLLRAWRDHADRFAKSTKKMMQGVLGQATKISEGLRRAITPGLLENITASQRLSAQISDMMPSIKIADQLKGITSISDHIKGLGLGRDIGALAGRPSILDIAREASAVPRYEQVEIPRLPELNLTNPIHETNERLSEMGEHIAEMRELAATTATMQQSLNTVATQILTSFAEGAEESKTATENGLKLSRRALLVAVISAVLTAVAVSLTAWGLDQQNEAAAENFVVEQQRYAEEVRLRREELAATIRLAEALEREPPSAPPQSTPTRR